jgi:hypothetical protein
VTDSRAETNQLLKRAAEALESIAGSLERIANPPKSVNLPAPSDKSWVTTESIEDDPRGRTPWEALIARPKPPPDDTAI